MKDQQIKKSLRPRTEKLYPRNGAKKCCRTDCSGHRDNGSDWGLSLLSPISLFKLSPCKLREVDPIVNEEEESRRHS